MKQLLFIALTFSLSSTLFSQSNDASCLPSAVAGIHVVQPGETLYGISKKYKVTIANLRQWNNIAENAILPKCTSLAINAPNSPKSDVPKSYDYVGSKSSKTTRTVAPSYTKTSNKTHKVMDGESLASISEKYGYTVNRLLAMNGMAKTQPIYVNQELIVSDCQCDAKADAMANNNVKNNEIRSDVPQSYSNTKTNQIRNTVPQSYSNTPEIRTKTIESADYNSPKEVNYNWNPNYARVIHIVSQNNIALRETPQSIGALYGLTGEEVIAMNGLERNVALLPGQRLNIEDRRQLATTKSSTTYYPSNNDIPTQYNSSLPLIKPKANEAASTNNAPVNNPPMEKATFNNPPFDDTPNTRTNENNAANRNTTNNNVPSNAPMVANNTVMSSEEMTMVNEINLVRSNPAGYIPYIEQYIDYLKTNGNMGNSIASAKELIDELRRTPNLSVLQTLPCLYTAAKKHGDDQRKKGDTDHQGSDGSWPWDRVLRECKDLKDGNENLVGGPSDIRRAVILLLVDDGIDGRGHRKTMLQSDWKYIACHKMGTIGTMPNCWVQQFGN